MRLTVSAPGKIVLCGEHAVVYGFPAIVAAIDTRCKITLELNPETSHPYYLNTNNTQIKIPNLHTDLTTMEKITKKSIQVLEASGIKSEFFRDATSSLIYLLIINRLTDSIIANQSLNITVNSDVPPGSSLGSSAAYIVSLSASLFLLSKYLREGSFSKKLDECDLKIISSQSKQVESFMHGKSSGMDTEAALRGGCIVFQKPDYFEEILPDNSFFEYPMFVVLSNKTKLTQIAVQKVAEQKNEIYFDSTMQKISSIVEKIRNLLSKNDSIDEIGSLFQENHACLQKLQVSTPHLDQIVELLNENAFYAKLTGAGLGGSVIALSNNQSINRNEIMEQIKKLEFVQLVKQIKFSKDGLRIESISSIY